MTRKLVVTADDLGRDPGTTVTILDLVREGLVTATTVIPVAPDASAALAELEEMGVIPHLHVTLTRDAGVAWHPLSGAASLLGADGRLHDDPRVLAAVGTTPDVLTELDAQLGWMRERGLDARACDSHSGTLYGLHGRSWLAEALRWCARNGLAFRLPRDPRSYFGGDLPAEFVTAHGQAVALADELGVSIPQTILTNRRDADTLGGPDALLDDLVARLADLPDGTSELFLHPSAKGAVPGVAGLARVWETQVLRDGRWRSALDREGIELVSGWWS